MVGKTKEEIDQLFAELKALVDQLPIGLHSDWKYTNHFEMTCSDKDHGYWWLMPQHVFDRDDDDQDWQSHEDAKRLGLIMDVSAKLKEIWPYLEKKYDSQN